VEDAKELSFSKTEFIAKEIKKILLERFKQTRPIHQ
jgi:hypothetical protein